MEMPSSVRSLIAQHHQGGVAESDCLKCSSGCCSQGGFAILENVLQIYELYRSCGLKRKGYKFPKGLSFADFVCTHFDVWARDLGPDGGKDPLVFFHMKCIDESGRPLTIPSTGSYWDTRGELFEKNPWLNRGCVFLSHMVPNWPHDDAFKKRHCILHHSDGMDTIGPKPIDCVFYTCVAPFRAKIPAQEETDRWFSALARAFPGSAERFNSLVGADRQSGYGWHSPKGDGQNDGPVDANSPAP